MKSKVQEIHTAIDGAQNLLLEQAQKAVIENKVVDEHVAMLKELGFVNSDVVKEVEEKNNIVVINERLAKLILYYKQVYPFHKFLTVEKLDQICDKYNLIYAPVDRYKNDVPEKNLLEIAKAQELKRQDRDKDVWRVTKMDFYSSVSKKARQWTLNTFFEEEPGSDSWFLHRCPYQVDLRYFYKKDYTKEKIVRGSSLFIAAPKSHFNLEGLSGHKKGFFETIKKTEIKDPIVFRFVRGGIQVITKWGPEAFDQDIVNEKSN